MERLSIESLIVDENELAEHYKEAGNEHGYKGKSKLVEYLKELKTYKDAEEQGLILRLPCKVGFELKFSLDFYVRRMSDFGKTVFLTKEEAEQALAEMKGV